MKILWIVNTIFPYPAKKLGMTETPFGGWLNGLVDTLKEENNIELAIATVYDGKELKKYQDDKFVYYLLPGAPAVKYNKKNEHYWKIINKEFNPDLVHIHGTEFAHGYAFLNVCPEVKSVVSIQGLISKYAKVYYANIGMADIIKNITIRDIVRQDNMIQAKKKFAKRGQNEIRILQKVNTVLGRTTWDYANAKAINPNLKYYISNETLRKEFYDAEWNINNIEKHSLFTSQSHYPIKGVHYLFETVYLLKKRYPDIKLYIAGENIMTNSKIRKNGYTKYLQKLIQKYHIQENIIYTGILTANQMKERLLKTHIFILPSAIENSSNSLGEAMLLGMPCIATNTGGTEDMLKHKTEGFLYSYTEPEVCAEYVTQYFENEQLAMDYGKNARETAQKRHNKKNNANTIIKIYNELITEEGEE